MTTAQMVAELLRVYPGESWKRKVGNMSDSQVVAVYFRLKQSGKIK